MSEDEPARAVEGDVVDVEITGEVGDPRDVHGVGAFGWGPVMAVDQGDDLRQTAGRNLSAV